VLCVCQLGRVDDLRRVGRPLMDGRSRVVGHQELVHDVLYSDPADTVLDFVNNAHLMTWCTI
jgi:hypothetical protein